MPSVPLLSSIVRATIWRRFAPPATDPHPASVIALALLASAAGVLFERAVEGEGSSFQLYGLNSALLESVVTIAFISLFAPQGRRLVAVAIVLGFSILSRLALSGLALAAAFMFPAGFEADSWLPLIAWIGAAVLMIAWLIGAIATVLRSLDPGTAGRPVLLRCAGAVFGILITLVLLPAWPTFAGKDFTRSTANIWEIISAYRARDSEPLSERASDEEGWAAIELAQPSLLDKKIAALAPRRTGTPNLFVLGLAGWSDQNLFLSETAGALAVLADRFDTSGRTLRLVNNQATVRDDPLATLPNLATALRGLAGRMDGENDALLLLLTSHGNSMGVALDFGPLVRRILSPGTLKSALDEAGIKNRIIIVSACYSGVFVPELADENTVVITASSATTNSFGCSNARDWTYFGDAFFNQALRTAPTLTAAFEKAKGLVAEWEQRDGLTPSQPQIHVGEAISLLMPMVGTPASQHTDDSSPRPKD